MANEKITAQINPNSSILQTRNGEQKHGNLEIAITVIDKENRKKKRRKGGVR